MKNILFIIRNEYHLYSAICMYYKYFNSSDFNFKLIITKNPGNISINTVIRREKKVVLMKLQSYHHKMIQLVQQEIKLDILIQHSQTSMIIQLLYTHPVQDVSMKGRK